MATNVLIFQDILWYQLLGISWRLLPPRANTIPSYLASVLVHRPLRGHQISHPLDYSWWGHMKDMVYRQKSQAREENVKKSVTIVNKHNYI